VRRLPALIAVVVGLGVLAGVGPAASAGPLPPGPGAGSFESISPTRIIDTRDPSDPLAGAIPPGGTVSFDFGGASAAGIAVSMNVTVTGPTAPGYLAVFPGGTTAPLASNLNFLPDQTVANATIVRIGADGTVSFLNGSAGELDLVVDVSGLYAGGTATAGGTLSTVSPVRLLDTRVGNGAPQGSVPANGTVALQVEGRGGVPLSNVSSVILNVTVTGPQAPGYITAYPEGTTKPLASNLNFLPSQTVPNLVVVPVGADGIVDLYNGSAGSVDLVADVFGYTLGGIATITGAMQPLSPTRVLDTRNGTGAPTAQVPARGSVTVQLTGRAGVPSGGVSAVVLNVTATGTTAPGYITAYPSNTDRPLASTLNFLPGQTVPNLAVVPVGSDGAVTLYNGSDGPLDLVADISGYYGSGGGTLQAFGYEALGAGQTYTSADPLPVRTLTGVTSVASANGATYALDADGSVWWWGAVDTPLPSMAAGSWSSPTRLDEVPPARSIAVGGTGIYAEYDTVYVAAVDGTVWAWGRGDQGQIGNGTTATSVLPTQVNGLSGVISVAATTYGAYALKDDGTVWAWGGGHNGELGNGLSQSAAVPVQVPGLTNVTAITAGGYNGYALRSDGTVWSWGESGSTLGTGAPTTWPTSPATPAQVVGLTNVVAISGAGTTCDALLSDGTVWSWGWEVGPGTPDGIIAMPFVYDTSPVQVPGFTDVVSIAAAPYDVYAARRDGTVLGRGAADVYRPLLGSATNDWSYQAVTIPGLTGVSAVFAGRASVYALVGLP